MARQLHPSRGASHAVALVRTVAVTCVLAASLAGEVAHGQTVDPGVGGAARADFAGVPVLTARRAGQGQLAGGLRYGYTEDVLDADDAHHRVALSAAAAYAVHSRVELGADLGARYDAHVRGPDGGDGGLLAYTTLGARGDHPLGSWLRVGGDLSLRFPPAEGPGAGAASMGADVRAIGTHALGARALASATLGVRFDRSMHAVDDVSRLSASDQLALSASAHHALLVGAAGAYDAGPVVALLGLGWDVLLGAGSPGALFSPLRLSLGVRRQLLRTLWLEALGTFSLSRRPDPVDAFLVPIEPRAQLGASVSWGFEVAQAPPVASARGRVVDASGRPVQGARVTLGGGTATTDARGRFALHGVRPAARALLSVDGAGYQPLRTLVALEEGDHVLDDVGLLAQQASLRGQVVDANGAALPGAHVVIASLSRELDCDAEGRFELLGLPLGTLELYVQAEQWKPVTQRVEVASGAVEARIVLAERLPLGQIRGTVRGKRAEPLVADVRVDPLGVTLRSAEDGTFALDVAPGRYAVTIGAAGYEAQMREVEVEHHGVTVMLVDLRGAE